MLDFNLNEVIMYGTNGICKVVGKTDRKIANKTLTYYELQPIFVCNSIILLPISNKALVEKVKKPLCKDEVCALINNIEEMDECWVCNDHERQTNFKEIISSCDRKAILQMIKSLYLHKLRKTSQGNKFHISDERILKDAQKLLFDEFAFALDQTPDEIADTIFDLLEIEHKQELKTLA